MRSVQELPNGYREIFSVNLQKNKKIATILNVLSLVIAVALALPVHFLHVPFTSLFDMSAPAHLYFLRLGVLVAALVLYTVLHEIVHGITMKLCGTKKVKYGFTGLYAFAGSDDYYGKKSYIAIALAPVVVWGIVLLVLGFIVPDDWFWVAYFIQIMNISGAVGDFFVTAKFIRFPKDILVRDCGVGMTVYSAQ